MKKLVPLILLLTLSWQCYPALVLLDRVAVIVDEDVIMQSEVDERLLTIKSQINAQPGAKAPPDHHSPTTAHCLLSPANVPSS